MTCGTMVYSTIVGRDISDAEGIFFVCWDLSIRQTGSYRLRFILTEA